MASEKCVLVQQVILPCATTHPTKQTGIPATAECTPFPLRDAGIRAQFHRHEHLQRKNWAGEDAGLATDSLVLPLIAVLLR